MGRETFDVIVVSTGMVTLPPVRGGAVESYVWNIAKMFQGDPRLSLHIVSNVYPWASKSFEDRVCFVRTGSPINKFPLPPHSSAVAHLLGGFMSALATLERFSRVKHRPVVLHLNEEVSSLVVSRFCGDKSVLTVHNPPIALSATNYAGVIETFAREAGQKLFSLASARRCGHLILMIPAMKRYFRQCGIEESKISIVPLPVDTNIFKPIAKFDSGSKEKRLLYVGRLEERKNVKTLLGSLSRLQEDIKLTLVGDGVQRQALEQYVKECGLGGRVVFRRALPVYELVKEYQKADAFILPSLLDNFPLVLAEATASGLPVIVPNSPIYSYWTSAGFAETFSLQDNDSLEIAIDRTFSSMARQRDMGVAARVFALNSLSYTAVREKLFEVYKKVISN